MEVSQPHGSTERSDYIQMLIATSTDVWAEYDESLRYVSINPTGTNLLGGLPDELLGKTNAEIATLRIDTPNLSDLTLEMDCCVQQVLTNGITLLVIHEFVTDSHSRFYETTYSPVQSQGKVVRVFSIGREITQYRYLLGQAQPASHAIAEPHQKPSTPGKPIVGLEMPEPQFMRVLHRYEATQPTSPGSQKELSTSVPPAIPQPAAGEYQNAKQSRQNGELLSRVLDNIPQYIFWKDRNSVYLGCNRQWAEMAGIGDPDNVVGMTDDALPWTDEQRSWYLECDRRVMETNTPMLQIRESQLQADGKLTWREVNKLPIHDAKGNVIGIVGTAEDITERKLAEDLLKQSEATFRQLAKREELLNRLSSQIRRSLNLTTILNTVVQEVRQLLDTDRVVIYQFNDNWQGTVIVEDVTQPWISTLGEIGNDDCFSAEYAELYRQGRVRAIANLLEADLNACNVQFLQQLQVQANLIVPINIRSELWGLLIVHECASPRAWQEWEISLLKQLADQVAIAIQQAELYTQATSNAQDAQSQAQKLEQALRDLQQTQAQLIQTEKMSGLGQLVAGIAHEINNPINFIYGNLIHISSYTQDLSRLVNLYRRYYPNPAPEIAAEAEAIDLEFLLEDLSKILDSVKVGTERIRQIVLSLRNFSRLDEAEMKPVNIHEGIDNTLLILQHRLKSKSESTGIQVIKEYGDLPLIECYPGQLNQVFMNLLSNAIDALESRDKQRTPEEIREAPSRITICTNINPETNHAIICIRDNGLGMTSRTKAHLFEPFFTTKSVGKGTGLGLSISHRIVVEKHGGVLKCESELGQGTVFWVEIPVLQCRD
jgi:PAS domain S-box-containing protein